MDISNENLDELMATMAEKAKVVFNLCDCEGKGFITKRDMLRLKEEVPLPPEQLEIVFDKLDADKNGYLTLHEFTNGFGEFLGLSPTTSTSFDFLDGNITFDHLNFPSQSFDALIESFIACGRHDDIRTIKSLWLRLSREQPEMLTNFEDFVARVVSMLQTKQMDYKALQASIENHKNAHDEEIHLLYTEMETQIMEEKKKISAEEMVKEKILRGKLEFELQEKERRLQELIVQQREMEFKVKEMQSDKADFKDRNDSLLQENHFLEEEFNESKKCLEETQAKINYIKENKNHQNIYQKQISHEISEWIALERKNLLKQIQDLEQKNKSLMDKYDEYEEKMVSPQRYGSDSDNNITLKMLRDFSVDCDVPKIIEIISSSSEDENANPTLDMVPTSRVYKVVFVGDSGIGKSTFIHRVCSKSFTASLSSTIGIDFKVCNVRVDNQIMALQLWDTAGQERYRSFSRQYFRKADGIIAMYDITSIESFLHVREWLDDISNSIEQNMALMLLGTKYDFIKREDVTSFVFPGEARKLAYEFGASFFETSAKTGHNIEECILYLARVLRDREDESIVKSLMVLSSPNSNKKTCCSTGS